MLKDYLIENNISVYKLSKESTVPYTTLNELANGKKDISDCKVKTIENIARALNISMESLLRIIEGDVKLSTSWKDKRKLDYIFPVIVENKNYDTSRIHPLMQRTVNDVYSKVLNHKNIEKVILFGSSVNIRCNNKSDLDFAVLVKEGSFDNDNKNEISELIQMATHYNADIVWLNSIDKQSQLYKNIQRGLVIYE